MIMMSAKILLSEIRCCGSRTAGHVEIWFVGRVSQPVQGGIYGYIAGWSRSFNGWDGGVDAWEGNLWTFGSNNLNTCSVLTHNKNTL